MRVWQVTLTDTQFRLLEEMIRKRVDNLNDESFQRSFTVPEILEFRAIERAISNARMNPKKGRTHGKAKEV